MPPAKHSGSRPIDDLRRRKQPPSGQTNTEQYPHKTISEHFAASKQGASSRDLDVALGSSPSKRQKHTHTTAGSKGDSPPVRTIRVGEMYNFSSPRPQKTSEVVDLTKSPNGGPMKTKPNGVVRPSNFTNHTGPKKLVVRNLKRASGADPDEYYNRVCTQLDEALSAIFQDERLLYSMEELYQGVEIACRQDRAPSLYKKLGEQCKANISNRVVEPLLSISSTRTNIEVLRAVVGAWATWKRQLETIRSIFFYLDRSYLLHSSQLQSIHEMGTAEFCNHAFKDSADRPRILQGACDLVNAERHSSQTADRNLLFEAVRMFHALNVYTKHFEPKLMSESEKFYCSWTEQTIASMDLAGYVEECGKLICQELGRCDALNLDRTTRKSLETYLEDILIDQRQDRLLVVDEVGALLGTDPACASQQLFSLLQRRYLGEKLRPTFEAFIIKHGSEIVFDEEREQEMVSRLLDLKRKTDLLWRDSFQRHEGLGHSLREAFESFINKSKRSNMTWGTDNPKPGEMIAKYVDMVLKGGTKAIRTSGVGETEAPKVAGEDQGGSSEDEEVEISRSLDQVLDLFRFVHGKAVFEAFYKRDLARRLLLGRSASSDAERSMLTRLTSECGSEFTHNLEQMFKDIELAREEISSYKAMLSEREAPSTFDLSVNVLSASAWPSYPDVTVNVPESILKATASFDHYYKSKHSGRILDWKHGLAHCQLKATFPKGNKEIVVSSFQAIVLLSFNDNETMSYTDLQVASGLDDTELKRTLQSLACARYRVLSKSPKGKDVNINDLFTVNSTFTDPKYRIKINQIQAKETKAENKQTHERVAADRNYETQAAIVRIMKSRKKITHAELVSEVIVATKSRGVLDPADIKKNIEKLIDKEYMERGEEGRNVYNYMA